MASFWERELLIRLTACSFCILTLHFLAISHIGFGSDCINSWSFLHLLFDRIKSGRTKVNMSVYIFLLMFLDQREHSEKINMNGSLRIT